MATSGIRVTVNDWLAELCQDGEPLMLDDTGQCLIVADEQVGLVLTVAEQSDRFYLHANILAAQEAQAAQFYEEVLAHNAMPEITLGLTLAFDRDKRALVALYWDRIDNLDALDFSNVMANMTNTIIALRLKFEALQRQYAGIDSPADAQPCGPAIRV